MARTVLGRLPSWGGAHYFGFCQIPSVLRAIAWKQWKMGRARFAELRHRGVGRMKPDPRVRADGKGRCDVIFSVWPALTIPNGIDSKIAIGVSPQSGIWSEAGIGTRTNQAAAGGGCDPVWQR
jgi:hypothetical protein